MTPDRGPIRLLRLGAFSTVCLTLAAIAHRLGGGAAPAPISLVLGMIPVVLGGLWLTSRRTQPGVLFALLSLGQALLHLVFHLTAQPPAVILLTSPSGIVSRGMGPPVRSAAQAGAVTPMTGHLPHGSTVSSALSEHATHTLPHAAAHSLTPSAGMLTWHLVATALTAWVLGRGEAALWRMAYRLFLRLSTPAPLILWVSRFCFVTEVLPRRRRRGWAINPRGPPLTTAPCGV